MARAFAPSPRRLAGSPRSARRSRGNYDAMLDDVFARRLPTTLCTIYDANYPELDARIIVTALAAFNDVITRAAFARGLPLIDLRLICNKPGDYANPIEPSVQGGAKIAVAIAEAASLDAWGGRSVVIAR